jgi:D-alanyl-D-alanine carboxypeptidase/D-alanyl-D-alanine-endopeptidase (penicillin-binding protein 4)
MGSLVRGSSRRRDPDEQLRRTAGHGFRIKNQHPVPAGTPSNVFRKQAEGQQAAQTDRAPPTDSDIFEFIGPIKRSDSFGYVSVGRPGPFVGHAVATALRQRGITVSTNVVRRVLSRQACQSATLLHTHETTLEEAVWRCNTHSQNLFAEALLKSLAALNPDGSRSGDQGSWSSGIERLRHVLKAMGVNARLATFRDGSGLSHSNRVTGRMIAELLVAMDNHPQREVFRRSLAQPGQSGTLRSKRYSGLEGKMQGKTGSINGVRTLAGYARRPEGYDVTFALLINGHLPNDFRARVVKALTR